jgi:hypothetical protein
MNKRGSNLAIFSPRASFMALHNGDHGAGATWPRHRS